MLIPGGSSGLFFCYGGYKHTIRKTHGRRVISKVAFLVFRRCLSDYTSAKLKNYIQLHGGGGTIV